MDSLSLHWHMHTMQRFSTIQVASSYNGPIQMRHQQPDMNKLGLDHYHCGKTPGCGKTILIM